MSSKILFVYNANSGLENTLVDIAHKIISPSTYSCNLCTVTHGVFGERKQWKDFRESANWDMEFLHKNEFKDIYSTKDNRDTELSRSFPVIFSYTNGLLNELISTKELNTLPDASALIEVLKARLM